jgi:hypothetical protein
MVGDSCAVSEQTFLCRAKSNSKTSSRSSAYGEPFCLNGNCSDPAYTPNGDMMEAISRLSILKDIQGEISKDDLFVFKGATKSCKNYIVDFKNCCGSGKGWGKSLGLSSCSADEKQLEKSRSQNLCRKIGTYCSKKVLSACVAEKTTFCCFPTKMAKIFHEQGRGQLGMGWGDKKHPDCRGFTIDELSRIDFSKLDLSELYADISKNMKKPDLNKINQSLHNRVDVMVLDTAKKKEAKVG